jgi:hypothetical protein
MSCGNFSSLFNALIKLSKFSGLFNKDFIFSCALFSGRRLVETVIGQLSQQFHIEKVRARDLWHLTNRIGRKVLAHTVGMMVNKILGNPPLQFECLGIV